MLRRVLTVLRTTAAAYSWCLAGNLHDDVVRRQVRGIIHCGESERGRRACARSFCYLEAISGVASCTIRTRLLQMLLSLYYEILFTLCNAKYYVLIIYCYSFFKTGLDPYLMLVYIDMNYFSLLDELELLLL
jgi:hypothetical protein